jgi:hypothetical protein
VASSSFGKLSVFGPVGKRSPEDTGRFHLDDVSQVPVPKLKCICFFLLIGMQVVNFVKPWSGMRQQKLPDDILDGQCRKAGPTSAADIINDKVLERQTKPSGANHR